MISLRKAVDNQERQEDLLRALAKFYSQAIRASADCAVELEVSETEHFREQLYSLHTQTSDASTPQQYEAVDKSLRQELHQYHDRGLTYITRMRRELESAASAMKVVAEQVSNSSGDYGVFIHDEVQRLNTLSESSDLEQIRAGLKVAAEEILRNYDQFRLTTKLTIAQLKDEIRVLHQAIDADRQKQSVDQNSGAWNRPKLIERMDGLQQRNERFCAMVVVVRNWKRLQSQYSRTSVSAVLQAYLKDLRAVLGGDASIGRWSDEIFVAVLEMDPSAGMQLSSEVKKRIAGTYNVKEDGSQQTIKLETVASLVERQRDFPADRFFAKLRQLIEALGGGGGS